MLTAETTIARRVPANLKALRRRARLIQATAAQAINVSRARYAHWETGMSQPPVRFLLALCAFYGVTLDQFLTTDLKTT